MPDTAGGSLKMVALLVAVTVTVAESVAVVVPVPVARSVSLSVATSVTVAGVWRVSRMRPSTARASSSGSSSRS